MTRRKLQILAGIMLLLVVIVISGFFWNESRKEIVFLCGNFVAGDPRQSVVEQLDTANLSSYKVITMPNGSRIEFESLLNVGIDKCIIELNSAGLVERAGTR